MNKLRKPPPASPPITPIKSRTMMLAQSTTHAQMSTSIFPGRGPSSNMQATTSVAARAHKASVTQPMTAKEQYWAARAITAETLLSAKVVHHQELTSVSSEADAKRIQEVISLRQTYENRESRLEKLVILLVALLLGLVAVILYLSTQTKQSRKSSGMHFTIPILSPFASVVEHESSVIGSKMLTIFAAMLAICLYGCFRYWLTHRKPR